MTYNVLSGTLSLYTTTTTTPKYWVVLPFILFPLLFLTCLSFISFSLFHRINLFL